jgi:hypothetical protein
MRQQPPAFAFQPPLREAQGPTSLKVEWHDPARALPFSSHRVGDEVRAYFGRLGVEIDWRRRRTPSIDPEARAVILLATSPWPEPENRKVTGVVKRDAVNPSKLWVVLSTTKWVLGFPPGRGPLSTTQEQRLARALGRIVAHELVHTIVPRHSHTETGLMRSVLNRRELLAPSLELDPASREAFLTALAEQASAMPTGLERPGEVPGLAQGLAAPGTP